jgi:hypothetical protein
VPWSSPAKWVFLQSMHWLTLCGLGSPSFLHPNRCSACEQLFCKSARKRLRAAVWRTSTVVRGSQYALITFWSEQNFLISGSAWSLNAASGCLFPNVASGCALHARHSLTLLPSMPGLQALFPSTSRHGSRAKATARNIWKSIPPAAAATR